MLPKHESLYRYQLVFLLLFIYFQSLLYFHPCFLFLYLWWRLKGGRVWPPKGGPIQRGILLRLLEPWVNYLPRMSKYQVIVLARSLPLSLFSTTTIQHSLIGIRCPPLNFVGNPQNGSLHPQPIKPNHIITLPHPQSLPLLQLHSLGSSLQLHFFLTLSFRLLPPICGFFLILLHILTITRGTPESFTTLARCAQIFGKETTRRAIHASLLMAYSSVGSTLLITRLTLTRMGPIAADKYVSSLTCWSSSGFFPSKVLGIMGRSSHMMVHLFNSLLTRICLKVITLRRREGRGEAD